jgi:hypothetical protein
MSSSQPIHQIHATIPSGWRIVAADAGTGALNLPPADEIQRKDWPLTIDLARALSAGGSRTLLITLERPSQDRVAVVAPSVEGAVRTSHRVLIAADPATAVSLAFAPGPSWRLGPPATSTGTLEAVAELLATDGAPPLTLAIHPRLARVEAEAACWLLPRGDDTRVRLDLRLRVAGGALDSIAIELPTALNATDGAPAGSTTQGWRVESPGAVLTTDGTSMRLGWPALWSGERLVRLSARMLANAGRTAAVRPHLSADGRATPLRLDVVALSGDGIDVEALPIGRNLEADELPSWSAPPPGTHILAAWRPPLDGETGSVTTRVPHLHDGPIGYLDQVRLFTQIGPGGATTLMLARLAAPGLSALPLQLPPGMILEQALIDGEDAPVRKDADGLAVMLAGHTQVQLALRLIQPASPGLLTLEAPVISIPWLRTSWTVGVASAWHAVPVASSTLSLRALDEIPPRGFLGSWQAWSGVVDVSDSILEQSAAPEIPTDPRYLHGPSVLPPPLQRMREPTLALIGARLSGSRIGPATAIQLEIASVDALNQHDRIGRFLGVIAVTILACLAWVGALALWRMACVCLASALAAAAMVCAQMPCFGLLGVCEAITILAPLVMLLIWWRRSRAAPASAMRGTKGNV